MKAPRLDDLYEHQRGLPWCHPNKDLQRGCSENINFVTINMHVLGIDWAMLESH